MLAPVLEAVLGLVRMKLDIEGRLRALTLTAVLALTGTILLLVALGFGAALLYVWLQQTLGTMIALAIMAGGCAVLALIFLGFAFWRPQSKRKAALRAASQADSGASTGTEQMLHEAMTAMQQGSRESMVAAVALALVTGVMLGRKI